MIIMMSSAFETNVSLVTEQNVQELYEITASMPSGDLPAWGYTATAAVLFFIGFFGFFLNLFVIVLMCKDMQIWTPMNVILLNLVASDFSVSILGNPFTLISALNHGWFFGESVCVAYGFFMSLLGITSITTLTAISYERCCLVTSPFSATHLTKRGAKIVVGLVWLYSFAITCPPLFGWGKYVSEAANISCSVNWESQDYNATSYIVFLFVFGLVVPVNIIIYSYVRIIKTMRDNALRSGRINKVESRVTSMIFVMIVAFLIAWTPYSIFALSEQFGDPELITPSLAVLPALIAKSSICYNPLIYVGMNSQFRAAWRRVCGKTSPQLNKMETTVNHFSETSSRAYVECSFTNFDKKKKSRRKESQTSNLNNLNNKSLITFNEKLRTSSVTNALVKSNKAFASPTQVSDTKFSEQRSFLFAAQVKEGNDSPFELRMFSASEANIYGKAISQIIRANSYRSNIC